MLAPRRLHTVIASEFPGVQSDFNANYLRSWGGLVLPNPLVFKLLSILPSFAEERQTNVHSPSGTFSLPLWLSWPLALFTSRALCVWLLLFCCRGEGGRLAKSPRLHQSNPSLLSGL